MPYQYKGYCYQNVLEAAKAEMAEQVYSSGSTVTSITSITGVTQGVTAGTANLQVKQGQPTGDWYYWEFARVYPACDSIGPTTSNTGMSVADAVQLSWLIVLTFALAWSVKVLRRTL